MFYNTKDSLSLKEQTIIDEHLKSCPQCQLAIQLQGVTTSAIDKKKDIAITPFLMTRIQAKIENPMAPVNDWRLLSTLSTTIVAIGLFIGLFIGNITINERQSQYQENEISYLFNDLMIESVEYKLTNK